MNSEARKQFGKTLKPIQATKAYKKELSHFTNMNIEAYSWILLNEQKGVRINVNTYDGCAGKRYNADDPSNNHPIPTEKELRKLLKKYEEVDVSSCPVAELIS